jgi:glycosyltransferase involved in cell wall biosynthesis
MAEGLTRQIEAAGAADSVDVLGWLSDEELRCRYANAVALLHPSRFEGFAGLQVLEAMAQGTPVVALEGPGVTEALKGASILLPRPDVESLSAAIDVLVSDEEFRRTLGEEGPALSSGFTWSTSAAAFVDVLHEMAG